MSYILDALKRADAERERGVVPGLYARQLAGPGATSRTPGHKLILIASGTTLLLGAMALAMWVFRATPDSTPRVAAVQPVAQPATVQTALPAPAPFVRPPEAVTTLPTPVQQPVTAAAAVPPPAPAPVVAAIPTTTAPASPTPRTTASAPPVAAAVVPLLAELQEDIRHQIPALTITGTVYSDNPGQRLLLVNNQVLPQGSMAAPEVRLEEIGAKSSTFNFRGNRFRLQH